MVSNITEWFSFAKFRVALKRAVFFGVPMMTRRRLKRARHGYGGQAGCPLA